MDVMAALGSAVPVGAVPAPSVQGEGTDVFGLLLNQVLEGVEP